MKRTMRRVYRRFLRLSRFERWVTASNEPVMASLRKARRFFLTYQLPVLAATTVVHAVAKNSAEYAKAASLQYFIFLVAFAALLWPSKLLVTARVAWSAASKTTAATKRLRTYSVLLYFVVALAVMWLGILILAMLYSLWSTSHAA